MEVKRLTEKIEKLTDSKLKSLKPKGKYYRIRTQHTGLTLRVEPTGNILFRYRFQIAGRSREISIGSYPATSMKNLLADYAEHARQVANGIDPLKSKQAGHNPTIRGFSVEYLENCESRDLSPRTIKEYRRIFDKYIFKKMGEIRVSELRRREISLLVNYIAHKMPNTYRGKIVKGAPTQSNRVLAVLSGLCKFAVENELLEYNPAAGVRKPGKVKTKERYLDMNEIKAAHDIIQESGTRLIYDAFMLALLTGQRLNQIATLKMRYIKGNKMEFPAKVMKSGKPHKIYLTPQIKDIITKRKADGLTTDYAFPGADANDHVHPDSLKRALARLMPQIEAAGVLYFSFHDLRRTLSTHLNRLGYGGVDRVILSHAATGVTAIHYNRHDFASEIQRALTSWSSEVQRTINDHQTNIISINS